MTGPVDATVAWLTVRQLFARRRLAAAVAFSLVPAALALVFRVTHGTAAADRTQFLGTLYRDVVIGTLLPLASVVLGTTAFGGEIDEGTVVYLLVKPLARWRVVLSKYVVAAGAAAMVMLPMVVLPWLVLGPGVVAADVPLGGAAGVGVGVVLYCALFVLLGLLSRRALVSGLLYIVVLEFVLSRQIAGVRSLSVREFATAVAARVAPPPPGVPATVSLATVWTMGTIILLGSLVVAVRRLDRYEVAEKP